MKLLISRVEHKAGNGRYFKTVDTAFAEDDKLSGVACKLLLNLLGKPDVDWELSYPYLQRVFKEKLTIIKRARRELVKAGYLFKVRQHGPKGEYIWGWAVFEVPPTPEEKELHMETLAKAGWEVPVRPFYRPKSRQPLRRPAYDRDRRPGHYAQSDPNPDLIGKKTSGHLAIDG